MIHLVALAASDLWCNLRENQVDHEISSGRNTSLMQSWRFHRGGLRCEDATRAGRRAPVITAGLSGVRTHHQLVAQLAFQLRGLEAWRRNPSLLQCSICHLGVGRREDSKKAGQCWYRNILCCISLLNCGISETSVQTCELGSGTKSCDLGAMKGISIGFLRSLMPWRCGNI